MEMMIGTSVKECIGVNYLSYAYWNHIWVFSSSLVKSCGLISAPLLHLPTHQRYWAPIAQWG